MSALRRAGRSIRVSVSCAVLFGPLFCVCWTGKVHSQPYDTTWIYDGNGLWNNPAGWDIGAPAGADYNVFIDDGDADCTVTLNVSATIGDLTIYDGDALVISDNRDLILDGDLSNAGTLTINAGNYSTDLRIENVTTFSGGGEVILSGGNARILDESDSQDGHLINVDNTIRGRGRFGYDRTQITNQAGGTIDADVAGQILYIDPNASGLVNQGIMQASGGGILRLQGATYTNTGGTIQALDTSSVQLEAARIIGGTVSTSGSGVVQTHSWGAFQDLDIASMSRIRIVDSDDLYLEGTINNAGTLNIDAGSYSTDLRIESEVTLTGGGEVLLSGGNARILDESDPQEGHLINVDNTIHGRGRIGYDRTQITNQAGGTIDADVAGQILHIDPNASGLVNQGIMQASGGGILRLQGATYTNTGGTIQALDASSVQLEAARIIGGTVSTSGSGVVQTHSWGAFQDLDIASMSRIRIVDSDDLYLEGTINNAGTLNIDARNYSTDLHVEGEVTLTGGGEVLLSGGNARLLDESGDPDGHLINEDNLIHGVGQIGENRMGMTNRGTIIADEDGLELILDFRDADGNPDNGPDMLINAAILRAEGGGQLILRGSRIENFEGLTEGLIEVTGEGSRVRLDGSHIVGGVLQTAPGGIIDTYDSAINILENLTIEGSVRVNDSDNLRLVGTIVNQSNSILLNAGSYSTDLRIESEVTLTGGGEVLLSGGNARILDESDPQEGHLINVDNTIHGRGRIGADRMQITNQADGAIDADVAGQILHIDPNASGLVNQGIMRASGGGILRLQGATYTNTGATIQALDASSVQLEAARIIGGNVSTSGSGVVQTHSWGAFQDLDIASMSRIRIVDSDDLYLEGTINNAGTLNIDARNYSTDLHVEGEVTLTGGGEVLLSGGNALIRDEDGDPDGHLINEDNLIHGLGHIGYNRIGMTNRGTILADEDGAELILDFRDADGNPDNGPDMLVNAATLRAESGGHLVLRDSRIENFEGTTYGIIEATGEGSRVQLDDAHLVGGVLQTDLNGLFETYDAGLNVLENLTINGSLRVHDSDNLRLIGTIVNQSNSILLNAGNHATDLVIESEVTLTGGGEVLLSGGNARLLDESGDPTGHLINVNNTIHGRGRIGYDRTQITNQADGIIDADVSGQALYIDPNDSGLVNQGIMQASGGGILWLQGATYTNTGGTIHALDTSSVLLTGAHIVGGTVASTGSGIVQTSSTAAFEDLANTAHVRVNNNSNLQLIGTIDNSGTIEISSGGNNTNLRIESEVTLTGGGDVFLSHVNSRLLDGGGDIEGRLINQDNTIRGRGQLGVGRLIELVSNGAIIGESPSVRMPISVPLSGTGSLANVDIQSTYSPGGSPAAIDMDGLVQFTNSATLEIEIGGPTPGDEFDRLDSLGDVSVDGLLRITQIDLGGGIFQPESGDAFVIITADGELTGQFDNVDAVNLTPGLAYEVYYDYDNGVVTLGMDAIFDADFDVDGDVDGDDFLTWQAGFNQFPGGDAMHMDGDADEDGDVDGDDYRVWRNQFGASVGGPMGNGSGAVPEPAAGLLALLLLAIAGLLRGSRIERR